MILTAPAHSRPRVIAFLGIGQILVWGASYYLLTVLAKPIADDTGWPMTWITGSLSAGFLISGLVSPRVGHLIERHGGRPVLAGSAVLFAIGLALQAVAPNIGVFLAAWLVIGAAMGAGLYDPAFSTLTRLYGDQARTAITSLTLWGGFASTVFIPLIQLMIDLWGWRGAVTALGVVNLVVCAGLYGWVIRPERDVIRHAPAGAQAATGGAGVRQAMASPVFWSLTLAYTAHAAVFTAFTFHLYPLLLERGFATAAVIAARAVIGPGQVGGRIAMTVFAGKAPMRVVGSWVVAGFALSLAMLVWLPPSFAAIVAVVALYSVSNGILTIVRGASSPEMVSRQDYGAIAGAMNTPATVARALAPLGAAAMWSVDQSYDPVLVAMLVGAVVLMAGFWAAAGFARRPIS